MQTTGFTITAAALLLIVSAAEVHATHPDAGVKAKRVVGDLLQAYEPCTAPDTVTDSGYDACSTIVRSDPTCGFTARGRGRLKVVWSGKLLRVSFKLVGLDAGCENSIFGVLFHWRVTGDQCGGASCTLDETEYRPSYGACTVTGGECTLKGIGPLPYLNAGGRTGVELIGADIVRNAAFTTFRMGFFAP